MSKRTVHFSKLLLCFVEFHIMYLSPFGNRLNTCTMSSNTDTDTYTLQHKATFTLQGGLEYGGGVEWRVWSCSSWL